MLANAQWIVPVVCVLSITFPASTVNMACSVALAGCPMLGPVPLASTDTTDGATVFVTSRSVTVRVPLVDNATSLSVNAAAAESDVPTVITGASFTPVTVIVSVAVSLAVPSVIV